MIIKGKNTNLRLVEIEDAEFILNLRLDEARNRYISHVEHDVTKQTNWLIAYKKRENTKTEYYFIVENKRHEKFGALRLYDFRDESFCWGSWILKKESPFYIAIESALLVYEFAFFNLGFNKSHFDVRTANERVLAFHKRLGAIVISQDKLNCYFSYTKEDYGQIKHRYKHYLPSSGETDES